MFITLHYINTSVHNGVTLQNSGIMPMKSDYKIIKIKSKTITIFTVFNYFQAVNSPVLL